MAGNTRTVTLRTVLALASLFPGSALLPGSALAQAGPGIGAEAVGAALSARAGATWFGSHVLPVGSFAGTLRLSPFLELGAEGVFTLRPARISPPGSPDRTELSTGYGGLLLRWRPAGGVPGVRWGTSVQLGAGTVRIRSPLTAAELASENFYFLEPGLHLLFHQDRRV
ncbi:MAG: hypothetical protein EXR92_00930, partial [Gemmatimonadetes bacterium]|nr:hypothetical protein [Gemmatimonadota bacterium]